MNRPSLAATCLSLASTLRPIATVAQMSGSIAGTVLDITGATVPGARVEIAEARGSTRAAAVTDNSGRFRLDDLRGGRYVLRVSRSGFVPATRTIDLAESAAQTIEVKLELASTSGSLAVTASAATAPALDGPVDSGSRLGLTLRENPAIINVVSNEDAQAQGLRTTVEALGNVPGVSTGTPVGSPGVIAIRGFSGIAVSTLFDGTRTSTSTMVTRQYDTWSFDRIEVLKGPASVLYGEGSLAGAVNFVPRRPISADTTRRYWLRPEPGGPGERQPMQPDLLVKEPPTERTWHGAVNRDTSTTTTSKISPEPEPSTFALVRK